MKGQKKEKESNKERNKGKKKVENFGHPCAMGFKTLQ